MVQTLTVGALVSGSGTNLKAIMDACDAGAVNARVVFAGSDNPGAAGLARAAERGIPTFVVDYAAVPKQDPTLPPGTDLEAIVARQRLFSGDPDTVRRRVARRIACEARLLEAMAVHEFDLLVLAGFMRMLTPWFIDAVNRGAALPRIMNIHPALLPAFPGTDGYGDTFRHGCKVGGCTVHFVDYGEDTGPIIGQRCFAIAPDDTLDTVRQKGLALEWELFPACIDLYAKGRLAVAPASPDDPKGRKIVTILPDRK